MNSLSPFADSPLSNFGYNSPITSCDEAQILPHGASGPASDPQPTPKGTMAGRGLRPTPAMRSCAAPRDGGAGLAVADPPRACRRPVRCARLVHVQPRLSEAIALHAPAQGQPREAWPSAGRVHAVGVGGWQKAARSISETSGRSQRIRIHDDVGLLTVNSASQSWGVTPPTDGPSATRPTSGRRGSGHSSSSVRRPIA